MKLKFLIEKEFKQMFRNSFLPRLILVFPCITMILLPWAANLEITNIRLHVVDRDHSVLSHRLTNKIAASTYFKMVGVDGSYLSGLEAVESGDVDMVCEIPLDFEKSVRIGEPVELLVAVNAVNGTKGGLGGKYLSSIINEFGLDLRQDGWGTGSEVLQSYRTLPTIQLSHQYLFNPHLNYKLYMVPALMVMLLTLLCGFLPALNVVSEKEIGTIEQINVTPVSKFLFILAKLLPYWIVGFVVLTICFFLAWGFYGIVPVGHFSIIYVFSLLFVLVMSGFGLVISNYSSTMQQAMFVMWFFMLILILMSGLFTPIRSMPYWAQLMTYLNPLMYFMEVMRLVYLKGSGWLDLWPQFMILLGFVLAFNIWAVRSYRKN